MKIYDPVRQNDNIKIGQLIKIVKGELMYYDSWEMSYDKESVFLFLGKELREKIIYYIFLNQGKKFDLPVLTFENNLDKPEETSGNYMTRIEVVE